MKKLYKNNIAFVLLILAFFAFGCSFGNIKAEEDTNQRSNQIQIEYKSDEKEKRTEKRTLSVSSIVGKYDYDTHDNGEGYDNSLEITKADDGKLFVYISGSYIYKIGETQSMHEAEGKGDAVLRGDTADVTLVDEAGKPCRAKIVFKNETADVKIPDACQFNIALGGVYKKVGSKNESKSEIESESEIENGNTKEITYAKMMDYINDFDAHKTGEEFIITDVPISILEKKNRADQFGNKSYKDLFFLEGVTDDDTPSYSVITSKAMIESLKQNAEYEPLSLRMTAVSVESKGKFDVYRMPFITKIEGLSNDAEVMWAAEGGKPAKLYLTH